MACGCAGPRWPCCARRLEPHGFQVRDFTYPSITGSLSANAAALADVLDDVPGDTVHLVGHSLGGVLICAMLESCMPARIGRVVCLGSPLKGSRTAARPRALAGRATLGRHAVSPTCMRAAGSRHGAPASRSGSIAGRIPLGVGRLFGPFPEPNDGTVAVAETEIAGLGGPHRVARLARRVAVVDGRRRADGALSCCTGGFGAHPRLEIRAPAGAGTAPSRP